MFPIRKRCPLSKQRRDRNTHPAAQFLTAFRFASALSRLKRERRAPSLRIGIVGGEHVLSEIDSLMARLERVADTGAHLEWRSGFFLLNRIADRDRRNRGKDSFAAMKRNCAGYLHEAPDGTETLSCARALEFAREGFDGIIHVHAFGCLPQMAALPALKKIAKDYSVPLLSLSIGEREHAVSLDTRIEAFLDIVREKKNKVERVHP